MVDHRDKSECYADIISLASLSQKQKDEHERNSQIIREATETKDESKCDDIKGAHYSIYPPNMTKAMMSAEKDTKEMCKASVKNKAENEARDAERLDHYFELPGWGIKLEWEDDSDQVRYYAMDLDSKGIPKTYEFTTKNTEEQNACPHDKNGKLGAITRESDPQKVGKGTFLQTKIGDYYYYDIKPKTLCVSDTSTSPSSINHARILIRSMITGTQSQPNE